MPTTNERKEILRKTDVMIKEKDIEVQFDDKEEIKQIYAPLPEKSGIGLAIFNRMLKASGYTIIKV